MFVQKVKAKRQSSRSQRSKQIVSHFGIPFPKHRFEFADGYKIMHKS